jgi:hypothetical protein
MRRVLDALYAGEPVPSDAQAALSDEERAQVAALARTAHLTRLTLQRPDPSAEVEAAALRKAHEALAAQHQRGGGGGIASSPASDPKGPRPSWLDRLFGKKQDG